MKATLKTLDINNDKVLISKNDIVIAKNDDNDFHITQGKEYQVISVEDLDLITVLNDKNIKEIFTVNYFIKK